MTKIDKVLERIGSIDVTLAEQHVVLKEHVRRTELLESALEPVKRHVNMVNGGVKLITLTGVIAAILEAIHMFVK